tara:strand:- start:48 stop:224 length:177 start_codon:yes stop_codon:yes gene_type:complete
MGVQILKSKLQGNNICVFGRTTQIDLVLKEKERKLEKVYQCYSKMVGKSSQVLVVITY